MRPGDRLLMASDGLTGVVSDKDLARILGTVDDPQKAARRAQEPGPGKRLQRQRDLPDHPCRRGARLLDRQPEDDRGPLEGHCIPERPRGSLSMAFY